MSRVGDLLNVDLGAAVNNLFNIPETVEKMMFPSGAHDNNQESRGVSTIPVDILDTPKDYIFFMDVPGLSKSEIQVTVEDENTLVIRSNGKRKRQDAEDESCKYLRLERRTPQNLLRKFRLPENANVSAITAKCENGVLTVTIEKHPPPQKSKTVQVAIA
ncbi:HSP20-like chaperone [Sesbania bispinosa]|nr:HSP20-like chaperone [Sesbania bispinosa]